MKWLITGGCGFIGTSLVRKLFLEGGHTIRIVDNLSVGTLDDLSQVCTFAESSANMLGSILSNKTDMVEFIRGDILDERLMKDLAFGRDVIVHLAANTGVPLSVDNPRQDCIVNVIGTLNCLEAGRHACVPRFVFASSGAPVGESSVPIHEEMPPHPVSPYGAGKLASEGYCSAYFRTFGVETVALRFGNVYGPGSGHKTSVVAKFVRRALDGTPLEIYGDGLQTRDFIYIEDLLLAIRRAATVEGIGGEIFQIATASETTVLELTEILVEVLKAAKCHNIEIRYRDFRPGDVKRNVSDTTKAATVLGWKSKTSLRQGLEATVRWFLSREAAS